MAQTQHDQIDNGPFAEPRNTFKTDPALSGRERQTLGCLLEGHTEKEVAGALQISPYTVHIYVKHLYRKFGVSSRGQLLSLFVRKP